MTSSGESSPLSLTPSGTPLSNQAPKYGTLIPNRIFVGGIAANQTNEQELKQFFSAYGAVKDCKIIADRAGVSKGYGFVTFETQEDAEKIIKKEADNLIFKDRKLNIGPAIRKQQAFPKLYEQSMTPGAVFFSNGVPYTYQNGMAVFQPSDGYSALQAQQSQQAAAYHYMMAASPSAATQPSTAAAMYALQQQQTAAAAGYPAYASPTAAAGGWGPQWRWAPQSPPVSAASQYGAQYVTYPMQSAGYPPEMQIYATQGAAGYGATEMTDASMLEAAQAEGSMVMEPSLVQQPPYVDVIAAAAASMHSDVYTGSSPRSTQSVSASSGSICYGKRPAAPIVTTPCKHMSHPAPYSSSAPPLHTYSLSPRSTPPPAKVFQGHSPLTPPPTPTDINLGQSL